MHGQRSFLRIGYLGVSNRKDTLGNDRRLKNKAGYGLQALIHANHGHIVLFVGVDVFLVNNAFNVLEFLYAIGLHVAYDMTARKYILRVDNQPGTASNISVFVSAGYMDDSWSAEVEEEVGPKSRC